MDGLSIFLIIALLACSAWALRGRVRAITGAWSVKRQLQRALPESHYQVFNNITVDSANGSFTVDHLVVSIYGVFLLQRCSLGGRLYGSSQNREWKQRGRFRRRDVASPWHRAEHQARQLSRFLGVELNWVFPVVVLTGPARVRTRLPSGVLKPARLGHYIRSRDMEKMGLDEAMRLVRRLETPDHSDAGHETGRLVLN